MTYKDKLQDPRWQKKRLQVLERDNFACKLCGNTKLRLDVHHHLYENGKDPWDYSDDVLDTYCKKCHSFVEFLRKILPALSVVRTFYKDTGGDIDVIYAICMEKKKVHLALFNYYSEKNIELITHIPSSVIQLVSSLSNIQKNG